MAFVKFQQIEKNVCPCCRPAYLFSSDMNFTWSWMKSTPCQCLTTQESLRVCWLWTRYLILRGSIYYGVLARSVTFIDDANKQNPGIIVWDLWQVYQVNWDGDICISFFAGFWNVRRAMWSVVLQEFCYHPRNGSNVTEFLPGVCASNHTGEVTGVLGWQR